MRFFARNFALCLVWLYCLPLVGAQKPVRVLMLSDIHFDPFHDPALLPRLRTMPVAQWPTVLSTPASLTQAVDLAALEARCRAPSLDTAWPLLRTTLRAAQEVEPHPLFVTLSGDLLGHEFVCRFRKLAPQATAEDLAGFAAKTVAFVTLQLRLAFPGVPVFTALGNNDSGCADYHETPNDAFLENAVRSVAEAAGAGASSAQRLPLLRSTTPEGDYSVPLPAPIVRGRLIVLQDIFESRNYESCGSRDDPLPEAAQMRWLRAELAASQRRHEHVWVMAHIPPGIDVYASFHKYVLRPGELCGAPVRPFLGDDALADTLLDFSDTVRLGLFAHTHMDEVRLLHRGSVDGRAEVAIPMKLVPSVTPFFGNHPAFLVAEVDPISAVLKDWRTIVSPSLEGTTPPWVEGYRFSSAYHLSDLSAASVQQLAERFTADREGKEALSETYRKHFFAGDLGLYALGLGQIWPAYACAVREDREAAFRGCLCPAETAPK